MDEYPDGLAPLEDEHRLWKEPFQAWWERVGREGFPSVPRNIARHLVHRHWHHSPWMSIKSRAVAFTLECWGSSELLEKVVPASGLNCDVERGEWLLEYLLPQKPYTGRYRQNKTSLAKIMIRRGEWPTPIVIADQTTKRFLEDGGVVPDVDFVLVEGHDRFAIAQALKARGSIKPKLSVWVVRPLPTVATRQELPS